MKRIEFFANAAIIALALLVGYQAGSRYLGWGKRQGVPAQSPVDLVGKRISNSGARPYVVLVLSENCKFCIDSLPFYRAIADAHKQRDRGYELIAAFPTNVDSGLEFLARHKVTVDSAMTLSQIGAKVQATPTILIADRLGLIRNAWIGHMSDKDQSSVMKAISALPLTN